MGEKKNLALFFIISFMASVSLLLLCFFNCEKIFNSFFYQSVFFIGIIIFVFCIFYFRRLIAEFRYDICFRRNREKNIRDIYRYNNVMDPPETNN